VTALWDPKLEDKEPIRFQLNGADFRSAMEALTAVTGTFVFAVSPKVVFFAADTQQKRNEYEPTVLLTLPLPNAIDEKDVTEAANAVRGALGMRSVGWDSIGRMVVIRDHISKARVARSALEALLLPKGQVSIELQFLTFDTDRSYQYGASLQTTYELLNFGAVAASKSILPPPTQFLTYFTFGGGGAIFGLGLADATLLAQYASSFARNLYDATIVVDDGSTANFHVGDKYPIPQSLYTGFQQSSPSIYNPVGQFTLEDLGLVLKVTPRVNGEGDISMDIEYS
jgi:type II secretory pathway component GspD/PulD (secretin)